MLWGNSRSKGQCFLMGLLDGTQSVLSPGPQEGATLQGQLFLTPGAGRGLPLVPGAQESAAASPEGAARGRRLAAGQFFEASLISKTMRGWEEGRQRSRMASGPVKTRLGS